MSKKTNTENKQPVENSIPAYVEELQQTGRTVLQAKTREELDNMVKAIPANIHYGVGPVGKNYENGIYLLNVHII